MKASKTGMPSSLLWKGYNDKGVGSQSILCFTVLLRGTLSLTSPRSSTKLQASQCLLSASADGLRLPRNKMVKQ